MCAIPPRIHGCGGGGCIHGCDGGVWFHGGLPQCLALHDLYGCVRWYYTMKRKVLALSMSWRNFLQEVCLMIE